MARFLLEKKHREIAREKIITAIVFLPLLFLSLIIASAGQAKTESAQKEVPASTAAAGDSVPAANASSGDASKTTDTSGSTPDASKSKLIEEKKKELEKAEQKVQAYQEKTDELGDKVDSLKSTIETINADIIKTETALAKTQQEIEATQKDIDKKSMEIEGKESELDGKRLILSEYVDLIYHLDRRSMIEVLLSSNSLTEYLGQANSLVQASGEIKVLYDEIKAKKTVLMAEKNRLEEVKEEQMSLMVMQDQQRDYLEMKKDQKNELLAATQGEEARYQELLQEGQKVTSRLTEELTALQSLGSPINFAEALREARYASEKTGVRVPFLLGILRVESRMGTNVGGGNYKTDMNPAQRDYFEQICERLGYDPENMPVSRKPCYRDSKGRCGGWGGAMGPAQFMPTTWMGYEKKVANLTNTPYADPWSLRHALVAMGLKVAKVSGVTSGDREAEHKAANIYLAGGNWERFTWYGDRVMGFADAFEEKIKEDNL